MSEQPKINRPKPVVLAILDGWGVAPPASSNVISLAKLPTFNSLISNYPAMTILASGENVGLSWGEIGNSEVGHLNLGSGRLIYQNLPLINKTIQDGSFFLNPALLAAVKNAKANQSKLHILGLASNGNVHSSLEHLFALLELCKKEKFKEVYIHAFLDGRDSQYNSGLDFIKKILAKCKELKLGKIATISGRYYAMDRDNHWERLVLAYQAIAEGKSTEYFSDPVAAIESSYAKKIYDEEFLPVVITEKNKPTATVGEKDSIIFFNYRADRARQLTKAFVLPGFDKFPRTYLPNLTFVTMTEYDKDLPIQVALPPEAINKTLAEVIAEAGLKQLHIAETEKYAHVTYFFNGGKEEKFTGEDRILVPSPRVASYNQKPEMSAKEITKQTVEAILADKYDFIVLNFANADMVAHTANIKATIKAVETIDLCLKRLQEAVLAKEGVLIVTADHGNAEELVNLQTNQIDKEHSTYPVPLIIVGQHWLGQTAGLSDSIGNDLSLIKPIGVLSDVAPTILKIMGLQQPPEMTGRSLI
ncbi:MAG: 2,3-bisphosphoglycerate-independent phosphoglycerate mutase [Candidatus Buchananbacteria bacterium]